MAVNYTVTFESDLGSEIKKHHFGNDPDWLSHLEPEWAEQQKTYTFYTLNVDSTQHAVLMFQSIDVDHDQNALRINDTEIPGAIRRVTVPEEHYRQGSPYKKSVDWHGNIVLVPPNTLRHDPPNQLTIRSLNENGEATGDIDDFVIDAVVLFYQTTEDTSEREDTTRVLTVTATAKCYTERK